jgi:hypothetical protein
LFDGIAEEFQGDSTKFTTQHKALPLTSQHT